MKGINSSVKPIPYGLDMTVMLGKHYGKKLEEVIREDPSYILWAVNNGKIMIDFEAVGFLKTVWKDRGWGDLETSDNKQFQKI